MELMEKLAIIGTKDLAHQVAAYARDTGRFEVVGYLDNQEPCGSVVNGLPVFGTVADAETLYKKGVFDSVFIAVGYSRFDLKEEFYRTIKGRVPLATIICSDTIIHPTARIGEGVLIVYGSQLDLEAEIEDNVTVTSNVLIGHQSRIGKHSFLAGRTATAGFVNIGERCFLGMNSLFTDHVTVGDDIWICPGTVVAKDLKEKGKYMSASLKIYKVE